MAKLNTLETWASGLPATERMPVLFLGHGSPMNALEDNSFVREFKKLGASLTRPRAVVVVSAHWETKGTFVTAMEKPRTIHDFGGFPKELFEVQYPAPGDPALAKALATDVKTSEPVQLDQDWGLDHGAWTVVMHLFPKADVPVIQLSLDYRKPARYHYELAKQLSALRDRGVLIIGSGNIVHNLGKVAWDKLDKPFAYDWAVEANSKMKLWMKEGNHHDLINYQKQGNAFKLAIPTPEHYLPLLYALALQNQNEPISFFNDEPVAGSLTMTSVKIG